MPMVVQPGGVKVYIPDSDDDKPPKPAERDLTPTQQASKLIEAITKKIELDSATDAALKFSGSGPPVPSGNVPIRESIDIVGAVTNLTKNLLDTQGAALTAAQAAKSEAEKNLFTWIGKYLESVQTSIKNPTNVPSDPIANLETLLSVSDKLNARAQTVAQQMVAAAPGPQAPDDRSRYEHEERMEQLKQTHEIAMKDLDIKLRQLDIEIVKWQRSESSKQQTWADFLTGAMAAIQHGAKEGAAGAPSMSQNIGSSPGGLELVQCGGCGSGFGVAPGAPRIVCPYCNALLKGDVPQHTEGPAPEE